MTVCTALFYNFQKWQQSELLFRDKVIVIVNVIGSKMNLEFLDLIFVSLFNTIME